MEGHRTRWVVVVVIVVVVVVVVVVVGVRSAIAPWKIRKTFVDYPKQEWY